MNAFAPSSGCSRGCLPRPGTVARVAGPVQVFRFVALVAMLGAGLIVAMLMPVLTTAGRNRLVKTWFRGVLRASGVRLVLRGDPKLSTGSAGTLITSNHVSWLDIPAVLAVEPMRIVAKTDVRKWPVIGLMAASAGTLFIDRRRLKRLPITVADMAETLRGGHSILVFPEGTTWCGRTQGRFYSAAFQAAIDAQVTVRPVSLSYVLRDGSPTTVAAFLGDDTLFASVRRVIAARGLVVEVQVGPIADAKGAARKTMAAETAAIIHSRQSAARVLAPKVTVAR